MSDNNIDERIKSYRAKLYDRLQGFDTSGRPIVGTLKARPKFYNPTEKRPMRLTQFLSFLETTRIEEYLKQFYKRPNQVKYLRSMFLTLAFWVLSGIDTLEELARYLKEHQDDAVFLGYKRGPDGFVETPVGQTFRYNIQKRYGPKGLDKIFDELLKDLVVLLRSKGISLGKRTTDDGTPLRGRPADEEAEYNPHYKVKGYKGVVHVDLDHQIPLAKSIVGLPGVEEGSCIVGHIEKVKELGMSPEETWIDGSYASTENIAHLECGHGVVPHTKIQEHWVRHDEATPEAIKRRYQKYHNRDDFVKGASLYTMMDRLVQWGNPGDIELVGNYIRNGMMAMYEEDPDGSLDDYHQRNLIESFNNHIKYHIRVERLMRWLGSVGADIALTLALMALIVIALIRVEQGVLENLTSVAGLA